jgi:hypothetical protein
MHLQVVYLLVCWNLRGRKISTPFFDTPALKHYPLRIEQWKINVSYHITPVMQSLSTIYKAGLWQCNSFVHSEMEKVLLKPLYHRGQESIGIYYHKSALLTAIVRQLPHSLWSQTHTCWYIPLNEKGYQQLCTMLQNKATLNTVALTAYLNKKKEVPTTLSKLPTQQSAQPVTDTVAWTLTEQNLAALKKFIEQLKLKAYSASTIRTYRNEFMQLLKLLRNKPVDELMADDLRRYMVYVMQKGLSENGAHSRLNALKFYFEQVLGERFFWEIPRPKKQQQLPHFFNQDEVASIINSVNNKKHKVMLMLAYSAGLRVSEVVAIKTFEIDSNRMTILITQPAPGYPS